MKSILLYNPSAGNEEFPIEKIIKSLENQGAKIVAQNCKEDGYEKVFDLHYDLILIAGGDGTVEKILLQLRKATVPIVILPYGNANNIAGSLDLNGHYKKIVDQYEKKAYQHLSIGKFTTKKDKGWFVEGVGWGIFTALLLQKDRNVEMKGNEEEKVDFGIKNLIKLAEDLPPQNYKVVLDGKDYSGKYRWIEVMNTKRLGPQLELAPHADHGDRYLDVMLIKEDQKSELKDFLEAQKKTKEPSPFKTIKAKKITVTTHLPFHIDDELFEHHTLYEETPEVHIKLAKHQLKILRNR